MRPAPLFLADSPGIDFLNSVAHPGGQRVEWLESGEDLVAWLLAAGLVSEAEAAGFLARWSAADLDRVAGQARALREWFRDFVDAHRGAPLAPRAIEALDPLNDVLAQGDSYRRVVSGNASGEGGTFMRSLAQRWQTPESLLQPLAECLADVVCQAEFTLIKHCEGPACTLMFLDKTKGHARRWCSMAGCGNRAKQAAHRERLKLRIG